MVQIVYTGMDRSAELAAIVGSGDAVLFTGAGFSAEAKDSAGRSVPDSVEMASELWSMLFGDAPQDGSSLADLYDVALLQKPDELREYMSNRLRIGDTRLPASFGAWFAAPWRRIYTLNVDDLELAVARQFDLPRRLVSVSAVAEEQPRDPDALEVIHLNGVVGDDPWQVTFSTMQYAARLCTPDHGYEQLVDDLRRRPFVFVGTRLDEVVLWKHVQLERQLSGDTPRRHSFLIAPSLDRARQALLASYRIHWVEATAAEVADKLLR